MKKEREKKPGLNSTRAIDRAIVLHIALLMIIKPSWSWPIVSSILIARAERSEYDGD